MLQPAYEAPLPIINDAVASVVRFSHVLTVMLQPAYEAPLPIINDAVASVVRFSPGNFRRRITRPVSYYALFE